MSNQVNRISLTLKSVIISRGSYLQQKLNSNIKNKILFHENTTGSSADKNIEKGSDMGECLSLQKFFIEIWEYFSIKTGLHLSEKLRNLSVESISEARKYF